MLLTAHCALVGHVAGAENSKTTLALEINDKPLDLLRSALQGLISLFSSARREIVQQVCLQHQQQIPNLTASCCCRCTK